MVKFIEKLLWNSCLEEKSKDGTLDLWKTYLLPWKYNKGWHPKSKENVPPTYGNTISNK
jgi:hypothetical protein